MNIKGEVLMKCSSIRDRKRALNKAVDIVLTEVCKVIDDVSKKHRGNSLETDFCHTCKMLKKLKKELGI